MKGTQFWVSHRKQIPFFGRYRRERAPHGGRLTETGYLSTFQYWFIPYFLRRPPDFSCFRPRTEAVRSFPQKAGTGGFYRGLRHSNRFGRRSHAGQVREDSPKLGTFFCGFAISARILPFSRPGACNRAQTHSRPNPPGSRLRAALPHDYYTMRARTQDSPKLPTPPAGLGHHATRNCPQYYPKPDTPPVFAEWAQNPMKPGKIR